MNTGFHLLLAVLVITLVAACADDITTPPTEVVRSVVADSDLQFASQSVQRPFSDYLETQGTFCFPDGAGGCIDFEPPMKNFLGWTEPTFTYNSLFEYLGNADAYLYEATDGAVSLGTEINGSIVERELDDGRAFVKINVRATNILAWVTVIEDYYLDEIVFGTRPADVVAGAEPALGRFNLEVQFINGAPGLPIPDLFQLFLIPDPGQEILHVSVNMIATGTFREGSGIEPGTRGKVSATQVYTGAPGATDGTPGWTVEHINFIPFGSRKGTVATAD